MKRDIIQHAYSIRLSWNTVELIGLLFLLQSATSNKRELFFRSDGTKHGVENGISSMRKEDRDMREREKKDDPPVARSNKTMEGYVGFANLPNQVYRKSVKRGFEFTLMVVGKCFLNSILVFFSIN